MATRSSGVLLDWLVSEFPSKLDPSARLSVPRCAVHPSHSGRTARGPCQSACLTSVWCNERKYDLRVHILQ